jgi:hypothetical protein
MRELFGFRRLTLAAEAKKSGDVLNLSLQD